MPVKQQIVYNGTFISETENCLCYNNRAFLYGDSIFETLRVNNRNIVFFDEHLTRLVSGMRVLKYDIPEKFTTFKSHLKEEIRGLLNRNKHFNSSRVRISVFRKSGGLYSPETNEPEYIISTTKLDTDKFILNSEGLKIALFPDIKKPINVFSQYKTANSLIYTLAGVYKSEIGSDDSLIMNEKNQIIESISSNIFIVKNKTIYTPPITDGCINGIMRFELITYAKLYDIPCIEQSLTETDLLQADEIFLTNSIQGIQWVVAYKNKRYFKRLSAFLINKLNDVTI
ncbi:MAG: aminotransferase class IV [Chlorobi bacterium]|nr:aminotransferase class IV [Chlorobiota bacterium]